MPCIIRSKRRPPWNLALRSDNKKITMGKVALFMMVSLDGFFEGPNHQLDWHHVDAEFNDFAIKQLDNADTLLFGARTYELMANYWSRASAKKDDPDVAGRMNAMSKVAFSRTFEKVEWENTRLVKDNVADEIKKMKEASGKDLLMLGSNNLAVGFLEMGLLDEIRIMVNPVVLGAGHALFTGIQKKFELKLLATKTFNSGNVLLSYRT